MRHDKLNPGYVFGYVFFGRSVTGDDGEYVPPPERVWNISVLPGITRVISSPPTPRKPVVTAGDGNAVVGT